jgi:hypothetical protein
VPGIISKSKNVKVAPHRSAPSNSHPSAAALLGSTARLEALPKPNATLSPSPPPRCGSFSSSPPLLSSPVPSLFSLLRFLSLSLSPSLPQTSERSRSPLQGNFQKTRVASMLQVRAQKEDGLFFSSSPSCSCLFLLLFLPFPFLAKPAGPKSADPVERCDFGPASCNGELARSALVRCGFGDFFWSPRVWPKCAGILNFGSPRVCF